MTNSLEAWAEKKPDISYIRVFGCLAHMKIPGVHTQKLDDRSRKVVNLGRKPGTKGYQLFNPTTNRICISHDVVSTSQRPGLGIVLLKMM